eukprot:TRINITY_DN2749_c0_g1_i6.p1 TRINITY_DN2749_c0_g1~~TRINITY_DN2749_c0_g1_i6.p1  ORF type:complete len:206 (-),score=37.08 TRINITY_DN2749_c0_g1_i6:575-1192(-)
MATTRMRERFQQKGCSFSYDFLALDSFSTSVREKASDVGQHDVVCCFRGMDAGLGSFESMKCFFANVSALLSENGFFFGIIMDSSMIWGSVQKDPKPTVQNKRALIKFKDSNFHPIGCQYTFQDSQNKKSFYLIHRPTFVKIAKEFGLILLSFINCNDFYEDHKINFKNLLDRIGAGQEFVIGTDEKQIIGWHTTFVFQKRTCIF